jgi:hypothetical protein
VVGVGAGGPGGLALRSMCLQIHTYLYRSKLRVVAWRAGSAAFGLVTAQRPGVLAGGLLQAERTLELSPAAALKLHLLWRAREREALSPTSPHLLARPGIH